MKSFSIPRLFLIGAVLIAIGGFISSKFFGNSPLDINLHDTYFVVAHSLVFAMTAVLFLVFALVYYLFPRVFGRQMNSTSGHIHFFATFLGVIAMLYPAHYTGIAGSPRRYYDYNAWESFKQFSGLNPLLTLGITFVFLVQLLFIANFLSSIFFGKRTIDHKSLQ